MVNVVQDTPENELKRWLEKAKELPEQNRGAFCKEVAALYDSSQLLAQMPLWSVGAKVLSTHAQVSAGRMNEMAKELFDNYKTYDAHKQASIDHFKRMNAEVTAASQMKFGAFTYAAPDKPKTSASQRLANATRFLDSSTFLGDMATVKAVHKGMELVSGVVGDAIGAAAQVVQKSAQGVCELNPKTKSVCHKIGEGVNALAQPVVDAAKKVDQKLGVTQFASAWRQHSQGAVENMAHAHELPREMVVDYFSNCDSIALDSSTSAVLGIAGKCFTGLKAMVKAFKKPVTTSSPFPKEYHRHVPRDPALYLSVEDRLRWSVPLRDYSAPAALGRENARRAAAQLGDNATFHYFRDTPELTVAKASSGDKTSIIKEVSSPFKDKLQYEVWGLHFLNELRLQNLHFPIAQAHGHISNIRYIMVRSYAPGNTLGELAAQIGHLPHHSGERRKAFQTLLEASKQCGHAFGEFHSKGLWEHVSPRSNMVREVIFELESSMEEAHAILSLLDPRLNAKMKVPPQNLRGLVDNFQRSPGYLANGLGDLHLDQFVWDTNLRRLSFVDAAECLATGTTFAELEVQQLRGSFLFNGLPAKLTLQEVSTLQKSFMQQYRLEYQHASPLSATRFFDALQSYRSIKYLGEEFIGGAAFDPIIFEVLINALNKM